MSLRLLDSNWVFETATVLTGSSADPLFPVSNLQQTARSSVWHSSGNFTYSSTQNIDFKEAVAGSQLTATIAAGTYTPTTLASAIVSALQAAGTKLYTCAISTVTGKWTIATSNGTYLALLWSSGTHTANSIGSSLGFAVTDQTGSLTYTGSNIAIHTDEWIVFDCQTAINFDTFAMLFHPTRGIRLTLNAVVHFQASATNVWTAPAVDVVITPNENFQAGVNFWSSIQTYRYARLHIIDPTNPDLYVEVSKISFAAATVLSRPAANAFTISDVDSTKIVETDYGVRYGDSYPVRRQLSIQHSSTPYSDLTTLRNIYRELGQSIPFVICFVEFSGRTNAFTNEDFLIYGCLPSQIDGKHINSGYFDQAYVIQEVS